MKKLLTYIAVIGVFALLFSLGGDLMAQCPMCKAAVETGKADAVFSTSRKETRSSACQETRLAESACISG